MEELPLSSDHRSNEKLSRHLYDIGSRREDKSYSASVFHLES